MNHFKSPCFFLSLFTFMFLAGQFIASQALAATAYKIYGFAVAGNDLINGSPSGVSSIGWISFSGSNCGTCASGTCTGSGLSGCPSTSTHYADYGVTITDDGNGSTATLAGYAWSDSLGWISFNPSVNSACPGGAGCQAKLEISTGKIIGWARVIAACQGSGANGIGNYWDGAKCTDTRAGEGSGGWDGWVKLSGETTGNVDYGWVVTTAGATKGDITGYAYGATDSGDLAKGVVGWVKIKNAHTDFPFGGNVDLPVARMACDASACDGTKVKCDTDPNSIWVMYQPTGPCNFRLINNSTNVDQSIWKFDAAHSYTINGKADISVPNLGISDPASPFDVILTVRNAAGQDTAHHLLAILQDVRAGFMCSLDGVAWQACSSQSFLNKVKKNETIYLKDDPSIPNVGNNYSKPSDGATIVSREWTLNGVSIDPVNGDGDVLTNSNMASMSLIKKNNSLKLTVTDSNGRKNAISYPFNASALPSWQEISPIGAMWKNLLAGVFGAINSIAR